MLRRLAQPTKVIAGALLALGSYLPGVFLVAPPLQAQKQIAAIDFTLPDLGKLSDSERALSVKQLALKIRTFSGCAEKGVLASELLNAADDVPASLDDPRLAAALDKVDAEDREIEKTDFTLADMQGKRWTMKDLRGKVVLLNFWFIGCPPCVDEIPALDALYERFRDQGLVVLAIAGDDDATALRGFVRAHRVAYPVLPDSGRKVTERFHVVGVPRTMMFDQSGKLTGQVIGARTQTEFAQMLGQAGLLGNPSAATSGRFAKIATRCAPLSLLRNYQLHDGMSRSAIPLWQTASLTVWCTMLTGLKCVVTQCGKTAQGPIRRLSNAGSPQSAETDFLFGRATPR